MSHSDDCLDQLWEVFDATKFVEIELKEIEPEVSIYDQLMMSKPKPFCNKHFKKTLRNWANAVDKLKQMYEERFLNLEKYEIGEEEIFNASGYIASLICLKKGFEPSVLESLTISDFNGECKGNYTNDLPNRFFECGYFIVKPLSSFPVQMIAFTLEEKIILDNYIQYIWPKIEAERSESRKRLFPIIASSGMSFLHSFLDHCKIGFRCNQIRKVFSEQLPKILFPWCKDLLDIYLCRDPSNSYDYDATLAAEAEDMMDRVVKALLQPATEEDLVGESLGESVPLGIEDQVLHNDRGVVGQVMEYIERNLSRKPTISDIKKDIIRQALKALDFGWDFYSAGRIKTDIKKQLRSVSVEFAKEDNYPRKKTCKQSKREKQSSINMKLLSESEMKEFVRQCDDLFNQFKTDYPITNDINGSIYLKDIRRYVPDGNKLMIYSIKNRYIYALRQNRSEAVVDYLEEKLGRKMSKSDYSKVNFNAEVDSAFEKLKITSYRPSALLIRREIERRINNQMPKDQQFKFRSR
ncbi:hypothetical protein QYM36_012826 [Artemia franciscana]|uniref:Uncharacterized protein n=1 Tax=Artemia franciscana TaxID=6661 RepID=A0AA88HTP1_ARTSF|nr:hypothetical protein QYM36_012826 [Artemia franciscana]